ncbi:MAG: TerB family tellurite resistance protein [Gammaproteobacteria bacterium]
MINTIKEYFEGLLANSSDDNKNNKSLELATAVLMIEISLADDHIDDRERDEIKKQMTTGFDLDDQTIQELIEAAEKEVDHSVSLYEFTSLLNDKLPMEDRVAVVKNLWRIAYADNVLDKYEEYYIRKVADLLYVAHSDFIKSKLDAAN